MPALAESLKPPVMTRDEFYEFCRAHPDLRLERTANGEVIIMPPTGGGTGVRNLSLSGQLWLWNERQRLGQAFDSSTGFTLPNGADRSPDASWVPHERWNALTPAQKRGFVPLCPDFVVELRSPSDHLDTIRAKMREYMANGARLGWLIDPDHRRVEIYRPGEEVVMLDNPETLSGDPVLPGFELDLRPVFSDV